jgi:hypothetical protein
MGACNYEMKNTPNVLQREHQVSFDVCIAHFVVACSPGTRFGRFWMHIFEKDLAKTFPNGRPDYHSKQSTEYPILFRSCGHETPFSDQKGHQKSEIPCSAYKLFVFAPCSGQK